MSLANEQGLLWLVNTKVLVSIFNCFGLQLNVKCMLLSKILLSKFLKELISKKLLKKIHSFSKKKITIDQLAFGPVAELFLQ